METSFEFFFIFIFFMKISSSENKQCIKSETVVNGRLIKCSGKLLFSDEFNGYDLDTSLWKLSGSKYQLLDGSIKLGISDITSKFSFENGRIQFRAKSEDRIGNMQFAFVTMDRKIYITGLSFLRSLDFVPPQNIQFKEFHNYTIIWQRNLIEYFIDGKTVLKKEITKETSLRKSYEINLEGLIVDYILVYSIVASPCEETVTEMFPPPKKPICKGDIIFWEDFNNDNLNETIWMHEVHGPPTNRDEEFTLSDGKAFVKDNLLHIKPILWTECRPDLDIMNSFLNLTDRCTSLQDRTKECELRAWGQFIMPPVVAPRISTRNSFSFKYGRIDIRAKLPKGDWIVPLILLEPLIERYGRTGYDSGQIRVAMARGNENLKTADGKNIASDIFFGGPVLSSDARLRNYFMVNQTDDSSIIDGFYDFSMEWDPNKMEFFVDGESYGVINGKFKESLLNNRWKSGGAMAPFDTLFFITLGVSVGGFGDFADGVKSENHDKPWRNLDPKARLHFWQQMYKWYPSWMQSETQLIVDYVKVVAL